MEAFGMAVVLACGLIAAPAFCFFLARMAGHFPQTFALAARACIVLLCLFGAELLLVAMFGAVGSRKLLGPAFFPVHLLLTVCAAPALAGAVLCGRRNLKRWWPGVAVCCWVLGAFCIFYQGNVAETLFGLDGQPGPYQGPGG